MGTIRICGLDFAYRPSAPIFRSFDLEIGQGERWSITGPSGCGKTTLLYLLAGLRRPSAGEIDLGDASSGAGLPVGLILQDYGLLPWATAVENIGLGMRIRKMGSREVEATTREWLRELGLSAAANQYPAELSGGQRQRVAIARTLALQPRLLLMDEPFSALDAPAREDLLEILLGLWRKTGPTLVLVTHNLEEALLWGSRVLVLGRPPQSAARVLENPLAGQPDYALSPSFLEQRRRLKALIESETHTPKGGPGLE